MSNVMDRRTENLLRDKVVETMKNASLGWDIPHTLAAAHWMKKLIKKEGGNRKVLLAAAYLHDVGYSGLLTADYNLGQRLAAKDSHMENGARMAEKILIELEFTEEDTSRVSHLVRIHDKFRELKTKEEIMVMEADCLAQIDIDKAKPTFSKKDCIDFINHFIRERLPRITTPAGKEFVGMLLPKYTDYVKKMG